MWSSFSLCRAEFCLEIIAKVTPEKIKRVKLILLWCSSSLEPELIRELTHKTSGSTSRWREGETIDEAAPERARITADEIWKNKRLKEESSSWVSFCLSNVFVKKLLFYTEGPGFTAVQQLCSCFCSICAAVFAAVVHWWWINDGETLSLFSAGGGGVFSWGGSEWLPCLPEPLLPLEVFTDVDGAGIRLWLRFDWYRLRLREKNQQFQLHQRKEAELLQTEADSSVKGERHRSL